MLLLGGRSKVKKKRKFCLAVLGLVVMLVVSILPENMQTIYASECGLSIPSLYKKHTELYMYVCLNLKSA